METVKQTALDVISKLPDSVQIDEIMYRLYVVDKINKGEKDIREGRFMDVAELRKEINKW